MQKVYQISVNVQSVLVSGRNNSDTERLLLCTFQPLTIPLKYKIIVTIIGVLIPLLIISSSYTCLYLALRHHIQNIVIVRDSEKRHLHDTKRFRSYTYAGFQVALAVSILIVVWIPFCILLFALHLSPVRLDVTFQNASTWLIYTSCLLNPFAYGLLNKSTRKKAFSFFTTNRLITSIKYFVERNNHVKDITNSEQTLSKKSDRLCRQPPIWNSSSKALKLNTESINGDFKEHHGLNDESPSLHMPLRRRSSVINCLALYARRHSERLQNRVSIDQGEGKPFLRSIDETSTFQDIFSKYRPIPKKIPARLL